MALEAGTAHNLEMAVEGNKLIITINLKTKPIESKSGKSKLLSTSAGNIDLGTVKELGKVRKELAGAFLGLNCYIPKKAKK